MEECNLECPVPSRTSGVNDMECLVTINLQVMQQSEESAQSQAISVRVFCRISLTLTSKFRRGAIWSVHPNCEQFQREQSGVFTNISHRMQCGNPVPIMQFQMECTGGYCHNLKQFLDVLSQ
jgi:hypothetical protein